MSRTTTSWSAGTERTHGVGADVAGASGHESRGCHDDALYRSTGDRSRRGDLLGACRRPRPLFASLRACTEIGQVIVVDTGGRARPIDPDATLIIMPNRGYGAAANAGFAAARSAGADMIALLNDDVVVERTGFRRWRPN